MNSLTKLFRLLEITRAQPQYGYALAEIPREQISNLAEHHYLVSVIAWRLCCMVKAAGATINSERVLEICLVHDLGELFGGDIAMPYAHANAEAKKHAKAFEKANTEFLTKLFEGHEAHTAELFEDALKPESNEALIAKIADYIEVTHYKLYVHRLSPGDVTLIMKPLEDMAARITDEKAKTCLCNFLGEWRKDMSSGETTELFEEYKK